MDSDLTRQDLAILLQIDDYFRTHRTRPTYRDVQLAMAFRSANTVQRAVKKLRRAGLLRSDRGAQHLARNLVPTGAGEQVAQRLRLKRHQQQ